MPSWWGKISSKEVKKKPSKESFIDTLPRKFKIPSENKLNSRSRGSGRRCSDIVSELGSQSQLQSRSPSPSKQVSRCQSFSEGPHAQPLPLPHLHPAIVGRTDSAVSVPTKPRQEKSSRTPRPACIRQRPNPCDLDGDLVLVSVSSEISTNSGDHVDWCYRSPQATDYDNGVIQKIGFTNVLLLPFPFCIITQIMFFSTWKSAVHLKV
ncbi:hypothetical protein SLA2020_103320 [Shorea laevis]